MGKTNDSILRVYHGGRFDTKQSRGMTKWDLTSLYPPETPKKESWWRCLWNHWRRGPDFVIGNPASPYLRRWWLIPRNKIFNVYLHQFLKSDDDRALHDHPWRFNVSILLRGRYLEHKPDNVVKLRRPWRIYFRWGKAPHRVELINGEPVWTVFITGSVVREWGFYCPNGWKHWKLFTKQREGGNEIGPGCDD